MHIYLLIAASTVCLFLFRNDKAVKCRHAPVALDFDLVLLSRLHKDGFKSCLRSEHVQKSILEKKKKIPLSGCEEEFVF